MSDFPFKAEYAKSGRAGCKACRISIPKDSLRLAAMTKSAFFDGMQPNWFHETCFFRKHRPKSTEEIGNFLTLRYDDQERIKNAIVNISDTIIMPKGKKRPSASTVNALKDFSIEYSKTSMATCQVCDIKITKMEVRISKTVFDTEIGQKYGGQHLWHHVKCFAENRANLLFFACGNLLPGFNSLTKEDKVMVKKELPALKNDDIPIKKIKDEPDQKKMNTEDEKILKEQNILFHKYRTLLKDNLSKTDCKSLLEHNLQEVPSGEDRVLNALADIMTFGVLAACKVCKHGQLRLNTTGYVCLGDLSEWTKCRAVTLEPERTPFKIPASLKKNEAFKNYKFKAQVRKFKIATPSTSNIIKTELELQKSTVERKVPPLKGLSFFFIGIKPKIKEALKIKILKLGGLAPTKISETIVAVISTSEEVENMSSKINEAKNLDIPVIDVSFFDSINVEGTVAQTAADIGEKNIASWGADPTTKLSQDILDGKSIPKSTKSIYTKSASSGTKTIKVKGGSAVDPDSGLEDQAHVYICDGVKYTTVLGLTDIVSQKNSYYKLQLLESDKMDKFWLFRSWGRIGTTIGGNKVESFRDLESAKMKFDELYEEKSGYGWEEFLTGNCPKIPGKLYPIDIDYSDTGNEGLEIKDEKSSLPEPTQNLIKKIFDVNSMRNVLFEFHLDTDKMPLGKLSTKQLSSGYKILTKLQFLLSNDMNDGKPNIQKITDYTNRFYTVIPHNFGVENPELLQTEELIKIKCEMLDTLFELEIAYSMLKTGSTSGSPLDSHYLKLKCEIQPLINEGPEWDMLNKYVTNTHAKTHSNYKLKIVQIFTVDREEEEKRYKPFKKLSNRTLLWHGSRTTNFVGILSKGLRIAPPEAPVSGYMFGKGIYFADMVSKSANYCCTDNNNNTGILLLCEVALGNMHKLTSAQNITKLPAGFNSVKGIGKTEPNPTENHVLECGTVVPLGKPVKTNNKSDLLYNEYIVYDVAQVKVKYLFQVKFKYNM